VVSADKPERDLVDKQFDYAEALVSEYWIVNPQDETIAVYRLNGDVYGEAGVYRRGETAVSVLIPGLSVAVSNVLDAR
jgi:Uma2 family endonuclease